MNMKKREPNYTPTPEIVKYVDYIKPHIEIAFQGKRNGHNFNSYFPAELKDKIPHRFADITFYALMQLSDWCKDPKNVHYQSRMKLSDFRFLDFNSYCWKWSQNGVAKGFENGAALLLYSLEIIEIYLEKNA